MKLHWHEPTAPPCSVDNDFACTEYSLDWREPLPRHAFGNKWFMWACVVLAAAFVTWMSYNR